MLPHTSVVTPAAKSASTEPSFPHASREAPPEPSVRLTPHIPRSRVCTEPLPPNMLRMQENIYEEVHQTADGIWFFAFVLTDIRDKYLNEP